MAGHTPKPWHIEESFGVPLGRLLVVGHHNTAVAELGPSLYSDCLSPTDINADARLISAAPDLLEACKAAREWLSRFGKQAQLEALLNAAIKLAEEGRL